MGSPLANTESRARKTPRPKGALVQTLDCGRVGGGFRQNCEREFAHGRQIYVSGAAALHLAQFWSIVRGAPRRTGLNERLRRLRRSAWDFWSMASGRTMFRAPKTVI